MTRAYLTWHKEYEEWEMLFRQVLMAERALLQTPATALLKTPAFGRYAAATLVAAAAIVRQAAEAVQELERFRRRAA